MGQVFSGFWTYWFPAKEYKIVMVGLDNAGKTTVLYRLHLGEAVRTQPTVGSGRPALLPLLQSHPRDGCTTLC
jgi:ADP-ribosylation factor-like protein 5B